MTSFSRLLFWLSICWALICIFILTIGQSLPFEFSNDNTAQGFYVLVLFTLPLAILLTLIKQRSIRKTQTVRILTIIAAIFSFLFLCLYVFGKTMCGYITDEILFVNQSDKSVKIIKRHYDCGATDSDLPKYKYYKIKELTSQILYSKKVDTAQLDKNFWIRIDNK